MKRDINQELKLWKDSEGRKPLLLRNARQTGKTFAAQQFGTEEFQNTIYLNLERNPELKDIINCKSTGLHQAGFVLPGEECQKQPCGN